MWIDLYLIFLTISLILWSSKSFRHYLSKIIHTDEVNVDTLAKGTTGFTGADIENMINQAALKAASDGCPMVLMSHFEDARDRVLMGAHF